MNEELKNLLEGIETANNIKQYDEGLADVVKGAGRAIANVFGTKVGAAQRNLQAAQQNQQAAQINQDTANLQAASADQVAQPIIDLLNKAFKKDLKTQAKNDKNAAKQKQQQAVDAQKEANATQQSKPENNGTGDTNATK